MDPIKIPKEITLEEKKEVLEIFEDKLESHNLKLIALTKKYNYASSCSDNDFKPENPISPYEAGEGHCVSTKELHIANLRLDMNAVKETLMGTASVVNSIKSEIASLEQKEPKELKQE